jgi:hypothetical protein
MKGMSELLSPELVAKLSKLTSSEIEARLDALSAEEGVLRHLMRTARRREREADALARSKARRHQEAASKEASHA